MFYREREKQEIREWIQAAFSVAEEKFNAQILELRQEISDLKKTNLEVMRELEDLKFRAESGVESAQSSPESIFYLDEPPDVYITNARMEIQGRLNLAADVDEIKNFLSANGGDTGAKFQRLIESHEELISSFGVRINIDEIADDELSEAVTARYFKVFQQIIFDNVIVAINRGLDEDPVFYFEFLRRVNDYLNRCGIYTVNAKSGVQVSDEDYQNMTPQIRKTGDKKLAGTIAEIERLPYRINYVNEFGELKFLQYNGVMTVYKAV
ncbi:MAG: hypothetical protein J5809_06330 [Selenomonadaceae bacterium]|nr:hypothetical protein [Selenomonadaceae bacterium]